MVYPSFIFCEFQLAYSTDFYKWVHCNAFNKSIKVGRESFAEKLATFIVLDSRLGKNFISI